VTGVPALNAVRRIMKDRKRSKRSIAKK